jgi:hypothetical protein
MKLLLNILIAIIVGFFVYQVKGSFPYFYTVIASFVILHTSTE